MLLTYVAKDDKGNAGQTIPLTQGESRTISIFLFNSDGTPLSFPGTISEILLKIFSQINQSSIVKKFSSSQVAAITKGGAETSNLIGFQFSLSASDTPNMAANNSGLPMTVFITDSLGKVLEIDFVALFNVSVPVVTT